MIRGAVPLRKSTRAYLAAIGAVLVGIFAGPLTGTAVAAPPVCTDQFLTVESGVPIEIPVTGPCTGGDGPGPLQGQVVSFPSHGSLGPGPGGGATYTSANGYEGPDSFNYRVSDGSELSNVATVYIDVTPGESPPDVEPPVCDDVTASEINTVGTTFWMNCEDPDSGILEMTVHLVDPPQHGSIPGGLYYSGSTYISDPGFSGTDTFTVQVSDGQNLSNLVTVTIEVEPFPVGNLPPTCPASHAYVTEGQSIVLKANCVDPDGDPLFYGLTAPYVTGGTAGPPFTFDSITYTPNPGTLFDALGYYAKDPFHPQVDFAVQISVVPPGQELFETAPEVTPATPQAASVTSPVEGPVYVDDRAVTTVPPTGFFLLDREFDITAPPATDPAQPLRFVFKFDESIVSQFGFPPEEVEVFRNAVAVADCANPGAGVADPTPCVQSREVQPDGDLWVTALTMEASIWNFGHPASIGPGVADVAITKTAAPTNARPGDVVTYTLKAKNNGPDPAAGVVITDALPAGLSFVSASAPCLESAGTVTCQIGALAPGEEKSYEVKVKVDPWGTADPSRDHLLDVQRVEAQIDLEAGQEKSVSVSCPAGFLAVDGSVRIDHIDQGTGDWTAPQVLESKAGGAGTWSGKVRNTATGRAQAKIFAICVRQSTVDGAHSLVVTAPVTTSEVVPAGQKEATLQCGPGQVAIQPGFTSNQAASLIYSQPEGNGWKFVLQNYVPAEVSFSIRCLSRQLSFGGGHTHDLKLERIRYEVEVQDGKVNEAQLTCLDGSKGIVAGWDLDHGLLSLGNDPRPVTRAFRLYNPTDHPRKARLSLLCLGDRSAGEHLTPRQYMNTASISATTTDSNPNNNSSTAVLDAEDTVIHAPVPEDPTPEKPTPNNPIANAKVAGLYLGGAGATLKFTCQAACSGKAKVMSVKPVRVGKKKVRAGSVLATASFRLKAAGIRKVRLKFRNKKTWKALKKSKKARIKLSNGKPRIVKVH